MPCKSYSSCVSFNFWWQWIIIPFPLWIKETSLSWLSHVSSFLCYPECKAYDTMRNVAVKMWATLGYFFIITVRKTVTIMLLIKQQTRQQVNVMRHNPGMCLQRSPIVFDQYCWHWCFRQTREHSVDSDWRKLEANGSSCNNKDIILICGFNFK